MGTRKHGQIKSEAKVYKGNWKTYEKENVKVYHS